MRLCNIVGWQVAHDGKALRLCLVLCLLGLGLLLLCDLLLPRELYNLARCAQCTERTTSSTLHEWALSLPNIKELGEAPLPTGTVSLSTVVTRQCNHQLDMS